MATGWVKSLQCKSRAPDDVVPHHHHHSNSKTHILPTSSSCRRSAQSLKDVIDTAKHNKPRKHRPSRSSPPPPPPPTKQQKSRKPGPGSNNPNTRTGSSTRQARGSDALYPALTELPAGHPSRNVVEIIFHSSWSPKAFSGRVEMVFKVQNLPRTVTRFEEYREAVKTRASSGSAKGGEDHARCVADGNEVMRFHCLGPTTGGMYDGGGGGDTWAFRGGKGAAICTFSGSGVAHESAGGVVGRRAMLVCRVIAGRVCEHLQFGSLLEGRVGFDSVNGENGELLVFDSRAVLPCFLVIYKL